MVRQGLGETFATDDVGANLADDRPEPTNIHFGRQQIEGRVDPSTRLEQQRKVARENGNVLGAGFGEKIEREA